MAEGGAATSYIHGTDPAEQRRLAQLNELINPPSVHELRAQPGEHVLDVGSGLGQLARAAARSVAPGGRVVGIEQSSAQLSEARQLAAAAGEANLVEFRQGDALDLPLREEEWGAFDVAHARFLLEHVTQPLAVVRGLVRAVRPGGRIVLEDDDHDVLRLWPEPAGFWPVWSAYVRSYDRLGNDPYAGRRLVSLLHQAGALPRRNNWLFFGGCSGGPTFDIITANLIAILNGARPTILANDLIEAAAFDHALAALETWRRRPDAAFWFAIAWAEGVRPGAERPR